MTIATSSATISAIIAGYLANQGTITVCPPCRKAYPWATDEDWKDAIERHHAALELASLVLQEPTEANVPCLTGDQHGLVFQEYLSDDEYLADTDPALDAFAHQAWVEEEVLSAEWEQ